MRAIIKFSEVTKSAHISTANLLAAKAYVLQLNLQPTQDGIYSRPDAASPNPNVRVYQNGTSVIVVIPAQKVYIMGELKPHGFNVEFAGRAGTVELSAPQPFQYYTVQLKAKRPKVAPPQRKGANDSRSKALQRPSR